MFAELLKISLPDNFVVYLLGNKNKKEKQNNLFLFPKTN